MFREGPPIFLPYQSKWAADNSRIKVVEKSRRIGISWADAAIAALNAATINGKDTFYIGYNKDMAEQYVNDVAYWAKAYQLYASEVHSEILEEGGKGILVFRVRFASGFQVTALSSRPANLRSKKGDLVIDEAAFHESLEEIIKAAIAVTIWGRYQIRFVSTHNGDENVFNTQLVQTIREERVNYSLHRITFQDAITDGLYERICLVNNQPWTQEGQLTWIAQIYADYGVMASEELDCIPFSAKGGGKVFQREWFEVVDIIPECLRLVRFWDMAATSAAIRQDAYYTAGVKLYRYGDLYFVVNLIVEQYGPAEGDNLIVTTAAQDGKKCPVRWELEGGSAGLKVEANLQSRLKGYDADGVRPMGDKTTRAIPCASEAKRGNIKLLRAPWNETFLSAVHAFDGTAKPLANDVTDALSGAYSVLSNQVVRHLPIGTTSYPSR